MDLQIQMLNSPQMGEASRHVKAERNCENWLLLATFMLLLRPTTEPRKEAVLSVMLQVTHSATLNTSKAFNLLFYQALRRSTLSGLIDSRYPYPLINMSKDIPVITGGGRDNCESIHISIDFVFAI